MRECTKSGRSRADKPSDHDAQDPNRRYMDGGFNGLHRPIEPQIDEHGEMILVDAVPGEVIGNTNPMWITRLDILMDGSVTYFGNAEVAIFIGDMVEPRARVPVREIVEKNGVELNLLRTIDEPMKAVVLDPEGSMEGVDYQVFLVVSDEPPGEFEDETAVCE